ncbi:STAS domain-containing protein [Cereibacter ovatus]|uniref:STAS domain-containing protein n=1 Tax=Cereibacter ovatus TaxID=439529 RepID=UPI000BE2EF6C|nr:STAS domain-containing protein [Cereibacter ovatus]
MTTRIDLPARLDHQAARNLYSILSREQGKPIHIDCSTVTFVGGLAVQVLLSAAVRWRRDGIPFSCDLPSLAFTDDLARLGVDPSELYEDVAPCH